MTGLEVGNIITKQGSVRTYYLVLGFDNDGVVYLYPVFAPYSYLSSIEAREFQNKLILSNIDTILTNKMYYQIKEEKLVPDSHIINKASAFKKYIDVGIRIPKDKVTNWYLRNKLFYSSLPILSDNIDSILDRITKEFLSEPLESDGMLQLGVYKAKSGFTFLYLGYSKITKLYYYIKLPIQPPYTQRINARKIKAVQSVLHDVELLHTYTGIDAMNLINIVFDKGVRIS